MSSHLGRNREMSGALWRLLVSVDAARNLPTTPPPAYRVTAVLGTARRSTSVRGVRRDARAEWGEDLLFEMGEEEYRKHVGGGSSVKLVLERSDGVKLGFVVLSLRQAKLNAERREVREREREREKLRTHMSYPSVSCSHSRFNSGECNNLWLCMYD